MLDFAHKAQQLSATSLVVHNFKKRKEHKSILFTTLKTACVASNLVLPLFIYQLNIFVSLFLLQTEIIRIY